jgi:Cu/Ag efflux pump CusA
MIVLTLTGLYSLIAIPKESSPEVIIPMGIVSTVLRGASAEDTEKLITDKLESEIANIEGIDNNVHVRNELCFLDGTHFYFFICAEWATDTLYAQ